MLDLEAIFDPDRRPVRIESPNDLPGDWRMEFEERAAIMEYDGNMLREHAEAHALAEITRAMRRTGVVVTDWTPGKTLKSLSSGEG